MTRNKYKKVYIKIYENNKTYVICDICDMKMGIAYWGRHNNKVHPENILTNIAPTLSSYQLKPPTKYCEICDQKYMIEYYDQHKTTKLHFKRMNGLVRQQNKEYCEICDKNVNKLGWEKHLISNSHQRMEKIYFAYLDDSIFI